MDRRRALEILEIPKDAKIDEETINGAYKKLALIHHPDRPGGSTQKFQDLGDAVKYLKDAKQNPPGAMREAAIARTTEKFMNQETDLATLLKKYMMPNYSVKPHKRICIGVYEYHNKIPITIDGYGKYVVEHLGENEVEEYIFDVCLRKDENFKPNPNTNVLDIKQKVFCPLSTMLFGGPITYLNLEGNLVTIKKIQGSAAIHGRCIKLPKKGVISEGRTGDMILRLFPSFHDIDPELCLENEEIIKKIFI